MTKRQPGVMVAGLGLIVVGGWTIASALYPLLAGTDSAGQPQHLAGITQLWPLLLCLGGLAMLAQAAAPGERHPGLVFLGVTLLLLGLFFLAFTVKLGNLSWRDMSRLWPVIPTILGLAFLMLYIVEGMRSSALLTPVYVIGGVGILLLPLTLGVLRASTIQQVGQLWPLGVLIILLLIGFGRQPSEPKQGPGP